MLPVAYGMAAVGGTGLVVAPALLAAFGVISAYTMVSIGRACQQTKRWSFGGLWTDLVGKESAWVRVVAGVLRGRGVDVGGWGGWGLTVLVALVVLVMVVVVVVVLYLLLLLLFQY